MSRALGNVSRAPLDFFVEKMLLGPSHGTQALSECQTIFSDDVGTLKNNLKKKMVRGLLISEINFFKRP